MVDKIKELAEEHWEYVESICHKMYIDAFIHGYKHAEEDYKDYADKLMIYGEVPPHNIRTIDNYIISC